MTHASRSGAAPLLQVRGLRTTFRSEGREVRAVDGVSFDLAEGETLALVGESGSGKTAAALSVLRLIPEPPGRIEGGEVLLDGRNLLRLSDAEMRAVRGRDIAMAFQDPMSSLNPVARVGRQVEEAVRAHEPVSRRAARARAVELLGHVGIPAPEERALAYPHQLSGGLRQRVLIAVALACRPRVLIADEPTTALDATVRMQLIGLIRRVIEEHRMALLLITHDMGVVAELADRVAVMYAGRIVECAAAADLFDGPLHPYTAGLFASLPALHAAKRPLTTLRGDPADLRSAPAGCRFEPRCPIPIEACGLADPPLAEVRPGRFTACARAACGVLPACSFEPAAGKGTA